jgi:dipeptidyl aminopeptidase/acylaminoacyl peptidase
VDGTADVHVTLAQSERIAAALEQQDVPVTFVPVEGVAHFYSTIDSVLLSDLVDRSTDFLIGCATARPG